MRKGLCYLIFFAIIRTKIRNKMQKQQTYIASTAGMIFRVKFGV